MFLMVVVASRAVMPRLTEGMEGEGEGRRKIGRGGDVEDARREK